MSVVYLVMATAVGVVIPAWKHDNISNKLKSGFTDTRMKSDVPHKIPYHHM